MLVFGHIGITVGVARLAEAATGRYYARKPGLSLSYIDYRFLALGALLPDLIDKPLGLAVFPEFVGTTRSVGHSLAFSAAILLAWALGYRYRWKLVPVSLALGCVCHLVLDGMWRTPETVLWPMLGWGFPKEDQQGVVGYLEALLEQPWTAPSEIVGGMVIFLLFFRLWQKQRLKHFFQNGSLVPRSTIS